MQVVRADDVVRTVISHLKARSSSDPRLDMEPLGHVSDQTVPVGAVQIKVGEAAGPWPRPKVGIPVSVLVDNRKVRAMTVWLAVQMPAHAWVYGGAYSAGQLTDQIRMHEADVDLACCAGMPVRSPDELRGKRLRKSVRSGQPLMASDLEPVPDVQARSSVEIEVVQGQIQLAAMGRALRDGKVGEFVEVVVDGARTAVRARVIAKQKVAIHE
jgi:flagella basal body P-ring formation protein FlgA